MSQDKQDVQNKKTKMTSKQIFAIIGIIVLVLLYLVTLLAAIFDSSASHALFAACLLATVAIPLLIWIYTWMFGKLTNRSTFADFHPEDKSTNDNK